MSETPPRPHIPDRAPPEPGSEPMLDRAGGRYRPFREHFPIFQRGRASGHHVPTPNNLAHEVFAAASDQAAQHAEEEERGAPGGRGAFVPAFLAYARAVIVERMDHACPVDPDRRAEANHRAREAQAKHHAAVDALPAARRRRREARSERYRTAKPKLGSALTGWWMPIVIVSIVGMLESVLSMPMLKTSLDLNKLEAWGAAFLFGAVIVIGCEQLGSMIGAQLPSARRPLTRIVAGFAVAFLGAAAALTITMAESREENGLAGVKQAELLAGGDGLQPGFQMPEEAAGTNQPDPKPAAEGGFAPAAGDTAGGDDELRKDLSYTIPLALLTMLIAIGAGMRREVARDSIRADEELADAEDDLRTVDGDEREARLGEQRRQDEFERVAVAVGAHTDELRDFYVRVAERFLHLYSVECSRRGIAPRPVSVPPAPDPVAAAMRIIDPTEPLAAEAAPTSWDVPPTDRPQPAAWRDVRPQAPPPPGDGGGIPGGGTREDAPARGAQPDPPRPAPRPPASNPPPHPPVPRRTRRARSDGTPPYLA